MRIDSGRLVGQAEIRAKLGLSATDVMRFVRRECQEVARVPAGPVYDAQAVTGMTWEPTGVIVETSRLHGVKDAAALINTTPTAFVGLSVRGSLPTWLRRVKKLGLTTLYEDTRPGAVEE